MSNYTIERDIEIEAPVEVVWRTITEPELIRTWFSDVADLEARPGAVGTLTFRADTDDPHVVDITVVAADRPHRFSYRWCYPPGERATATQLDARDLHARRRTATNGPACALSSPASTELDWPDDDKQKFVDDHRHGWQVQGDRLRDLFASGHASSP